MTEDIFLKGLDERIDRQLRWRRIMSFAYFISTAVGIISAGAATVMSGLGAPQYTAVLAGTATVVYGLEKSLLFREKWAHHLRTWAQLDAIKLRYISGGIDKQAAAEHIAAVVDSYAAGLPLGPERPGAPSTDG